jgi:hypothetical protein
LLALFHFTAACGKILLGEFRLSAVVRWPGERKLVALQIFGLAFFNLLEERHICFWSGSYGGKSTVISVLRALAASAWYR